MSLSMRLAAACICAAAIAFPAAAAFSPAGTVAFANLETIAAAVEKIAAPGANDPVLKKIVPNAIRSQPAAKYFGPMRAGEMGVAVCYVDGEQIARLAAAGRCDSDAIDRAKIWSLLYPATFDKREFLRRNPSARPDRQGTYRIQTDPRGRDFLYAWYSPDGKWAALSPTPAVSAHTYRAALAALRTPLGANLARIRMDAAGARAVFRTAACAGATVNVSAGPRGLEARGSLSITEQPTPALPADWSARLNVPGNSPFFGMATVQDDPRTTEILNLAGPEVAKLVRQSLGWKRGAGCSAYYLAGAKNQAPSNPAAKLLRILPEARQTRPDAATFCNLTTVLRLYLPKVAATMMPMQSAQLWAGVKMLRKTAGEGMGFMTWREGRERKFLLRISYDELRGTANLWSLMLL